jgi:hypothetical protein
MTQPFKIADWGTLPLPAFPVCPDYIVLPPRMVEEKALLAKLLAKVSELRASAAAAQPPDASHDQTPMLEPAVRALELEVGDLRPRMDVFRAAINTLISVEHQKAIDNLNAIEQKLRQKYKIPPTFKGLPEACKHTSADWWRAREMLASRPTSSAINSPNPADAALMAAAQEYLRKLRMRLESEPKRVERIAEAQEAASRPIVQPVPESVQRIRTIEQGVRDLIGT